MHSHVFLKARGIGSFETDTQKRRHRRGGAKVTMESEIRVMQLQAKKHRQSSEPGRSNEWNLPQCL